jgi:pimeloyl-ACP methyl ester carboxylesterase
MVAAADGVRLNVNVYEPDAGTVTADEPIRDILLLHGWPNAGRVWQCLAEEMLLAAPFRLVAPDLRGFGASDKPESGFTCEQFARDAATVAAALNLGGYTVVGHSMSGKVTQLLAAERPVGLVALVLVAPAPLVASPVPEEKRAGQRAVYGDVARVREMIVAMAGRPLKEERLNVLVEDGMRASRRAWDGWIDVMREEDLADRLPDIAVPTLVLHGGNDPLRTEEALCTDVADRISGAAFAVLPNVGHLPHVEEPSALALTLVNFLDRPPLSHFAGEGRVLAKRVAE